MADIPAWREGITDEQIQEQENAIKQQIAQSQPLVGEKEGVDVLIAEYDDNPQFLPKIGDLMATYAAIRRLRGDGNCFYRALMVALGEAFVSAGVSNASTAGGASSSSAAGAQPSAASPLQGVYERMLARARGSLEQLVNAGMPKETTEDFHTVFCDWLAGLGASGASIEASALGPLRGDTSFYAIYFTRLLCSLELKTNPDSYLPFIMGMTECESVESFCAAYVEPSSVDADMVQIQALCAALGVGVRVAYLDASPGDTVQIVSIPENSPPGTLVLDLLYRPGHYDVTYKA